MEILRVPPYNLVAKVAVENPSTEYPVIVRDLSDNSIQTLTLTSDANADISVTLSSEYDSSYEISVYTDTFYFDVVRPYVNPNTKGTTASEVSEYARHEELARAIIDSIVDEGFYYKKKIFETVGNGADYISVWLKANKILSVYENNVLVTDRAYEITADKTAITQSYSGTLNRDESANILLPGAASDMQDYPLFLYENAFPRTFDYKFLLEVGYKRIPSDVVRAAELLIEDIACGKLDYYKRYIADYNTDQFKIKFDDRVFEGTGNILVDKILSKYVNPIKRLGAL
jgi:hypothetical protein